MKKAALIFLVLVFYSFQNISAQTVGGGIMFAIPQNEFDDNVDNLGFGLQGQVTLTSPDKYNPFTVGLNLSYLVYGMEQRAVPLSATIPDVFVDVSRTNSIASIHLLFQVSPFDGKVKPYFEGLAGGSYLFTETSVSGDNDYHEFASSTNFDDFAWSLGAGGGILIRLTGESDDLPGGLFLDLKARYMFGGEAEYLAEGDVVVNSGRTIIRPRKSEIDYLSIQIGVKAAF